VVFFSPLHEFFLVCEYAPLCGRIPRCFISSVVSFPIHRRSPREYLIADNFARRIRTSSLVVSDGFCKRLRCLAK